jgi:hypothetical protein
VPTPRKLPRRDWMILPLISLLTIVFMFGLSEVTTRLVWTSGGSDPCRLPNHAIGHSPECTAVLKSAEGPWVDYSYNDCGYRSEQPCHHKHPGSASIALLGASLAEGYMVPYRQTFAVRASAELTKASRRPVQIQNMGAFQCWPNCAASRVDEALSLKPDAVILAISPFDVSQDIGDSSPANLLPGVVNPSFIERSIQFFSDSSTVVVAKHFLYQNSPTYVRLYLMQGDPADFLRQPFTPAWETRFSNLDMQLGVMAEKIRAAGIPFILVVAPEHAQTVLLGMQKLPPRVDSYAFEKRASAIAEKHRIVFVDALKDFRDVAPQVNSLFYPEDGHLTAMGHALISQAIVRSCLSSSHPVFPDCFAPKTSDPPDPPAGRVH